VLHRDQHRAAPLAADGEALRDPQHDQQDRCGHPDLLVGGQQPDQEGRDAHRHQRGDEGHLPADLVADVPEDHAAERARDEPDGERAERREGAGERGRAGEELAAEHDHRGQRVDEEVVPLDGGADEAGERHPPHIGRGGGLGCRR
jgi:hypothetical protein